MSDLVQDTYFFDSSLALETALQKNLVDVGVPGAEGIQLCYYDGDKLENAPENCINIPFNDLFIYFVTTKNRFPSSINYSYKNFSMEIQKSIFDSIQEILNTARNERERLMKLLFVETKELIPEFSGGLKFMLMSSRRTQVMQYVAQSLAESLRELGHEVFVSIEENTMQQLHLFHHLKHFLDFKPNVTININYLQHSFIHNDIFNFVWFQDFMPVLQDPSQVLLRKRDYIYSLVHPIDKLLDKKGISFTRQNFCINTATFKYMNEIKRENKIVFVGSSYYNEISDNLRESQLCQIAIRWFNEGNSFTEELIISWVKEYNYLREDIERIISYIVRDFSVLWLANLNDLCTINVEIYGWGWERYPVLAPFLKGELPYEDVAKVYNSAMFTIVPHNMYILQQRTLEAAACGCQPIVYDCRNMDTAPYYEESLLFYRSFEDLVQRILNNEDKNLEYIISENNYNTLAKRIIKTIEDELKYGG